MYLLPETELMKVLSTQDGINAATFVVEPLSPGYGVTVGNALRRVMLASLEGSAVSSIKIDGITHEFTTIENMREDIVDFILNLKGLPIRLEGDEPVTLEIDVRGPKSVTAGDIKPNSQVQIIDPAYELATLDKGGKLKAQIVVEKGRGFVAAEKKSEEKMPLGTIMLDSIFTPIKKVHYDVENTRVGSVTNFDKLTVSITTNGSISPQDALKNACQILNDHFSLININIMDVADVKKVRSAKTKAVKKPAKKPAIKKNIPKKSTTKKK